MRGRRTNRRTLWLVIVACSSVLLIIGKILGWRMPTSYPQHPYYREEYTPMQLSADSIGDYPAEHHLADVPWFATEEAHCQSNSLQMIAAQQGSEEPREYFDFLMGWSYSALEEPAQGDFFPSADPEPGFAFAAPYLGLERHYYVTNDETLYLDALRYFLAQGYPVRVGLDAAILYDLEGQIPHSEVLVGYDETGFYYYETVCMPEIPCEPRHLPPGEEGLWIREQVLLDAVLGQARMFSYPWRYSLTIFDQGRLEKNQEPIWTRNGRLLIGGSLVGGPQYGLRQGADAIESLATRIEQGRIRIEVAEVRFALQVMVNTRHDNAVYLRESFAGRSDIERAAALFDQAANDYQAALDSVGDGITDQAEANRIAAWLREAAAVEREVGEIFLAQGQ